MGKSKLDTNILVALIGAVATIGAALIVVFASNQPSPSPATAPPGFTSEISETLPPAQTPEFTTTPDGSATSGDVPTATFTSLPLLEAGEDWEQNCISAIWRVYPASSSISESNGCYINLFNSVFSAAGGHLTVFYEQRVDSREASGIFAELPSNSLVTLNVHLDELRTGEMWIGVFEQPDINSRGFILAVQPGNPKNSEFIALGMPGETNFYPTGPFPKDSATYLVSMDVSPNAVFGLIEQYTRTNTFSLPSEQKWLFLGYHALTPGTNRIQGYFSDLTILPR